MDGVSFLTNISNEQTSETKPVSVAHISKRMSIYLANEMNDLRIIPLTETKIICNGLIPKNIR